MKLKCQAACANCPPYSHDGKFQPDNATITRFLPDLNRCAKCIAYASPSLPDLQDDLIQIASITLVEKGPAFNPEHKSNASFGTFIRPRICTSLINAKRKEVKHYERECPVPYYTAPDAPEALNAEYERDISLMPTALALNNVPDPDAESLEERVIWDIFVADFENALPQLLEKLTDRERQVFAYLRKDMPNCAIAAALNLSSPRVSQLIRQVEQKLRRACQSLKII